MKKHHVRGFPESYESRSDGRWRQVLAMLAHAGHERRHGTNNLV